MKLNHKNFYVAQAYADLSNNEIVVASGLSRVGLSQILRGVRNPRPKTVGRLAKALGCSVEYLIEDEITLDKMVESPRGCSCETTGVVNGVGYAKTKREKPKQRGSQANIT